MSGRLLGIYLNDHLAGATAGVALARRARDNDRDGSIGTPLAKVCAEIEADRETLIAVMDELDVRRDPLKPVIAWLGEKLGRLKPNGRVRGYSPLSRLVELEMLHLGVAGKRDLWAALEATPAQRLSDFDLPRLIARADRQRQEIERLRRAAAAEALRDSA
jgi:hypothetical protein